MKKVITTILCALILLHLFSCNGNKTPAADQEPSTADSTLKLISCDSTYDQIYKGFVYTRVSDEPVYPGGLDSLTKYVSKAIAYPDVEKGSEAPKIVFVIDATGEVATTYMLNKKAADYTSGDKKMIDVALKMPRWLPARCNGKAVAFRGVLPIFIH